MIAARPRAATHGVIVFLSSLAAFSVSVAQENAASEPLSLEEIVVTAQKREQRVQDVPISLTVMGGADLDRSSIQSVSDALSMVPGVATSVNGQGGQTNLTVRGVTASGPLFAGSSPIGYYLDSVPFGLVRSAVEPDANSYDLDRIEVLRGPQGTLYGASALNGVVRVLTNDANLDAFDFKARGGVSSTQSGGGNWRGDMAVNMPIIEHVVAARLTAGQEHDSGWINSPLGGNLNDADIKNIRLKIAARPVEDLNLRLGFMRQQAYYGAPPQGDGDYTASTQFQPINTHFNVYDLKADYQLPAVSITSATSYFTYLNDGSLDVAPGVDTPPLTTLLTSKVFTEELTLNSRLEGAWRWSVGAFYRSAKDHTYQTLGDLIPAPLSQADTSRSAAIYGEIGRRFLDRRLELTLGARYFRDSVVLQQLILFGQPAGTPLIRTDSAFHATTPRVVLTWYPSRDFTAYASYSQGFRSGFPQSMLVQMVSPDFQPVKPDKLHNYEIGGKGGLFDNRVIFDAAVYYMKWKDIQQTLGIPIPGTAAYIVASVNGQSASGVGADFAITVRPIERLSFGINASVNHLAEDAAVYSGGQLLFPSGSRIDTSPACTLGASIQYGFALGASGWSGQVEASARYTSVMTTTSVSSGTGLPPDVVKSDDITTGRLSFAISAPANWRIMIYGDNIGNSHGVPLAANVPYTSISQRPRTVGVQIDYGYR